MGVLWGVGGAKIFFPKFNQIWCASYLHECHIQWHHFLGPGPLGPWGGAKRSNIIKSELPWGLPGRVAQSVTCLATDACLTADPGVASSIPVRYHTFVEIDHEIISTVILLPSADLFKKGCCQLQAKVCAQITG